MDPLEVIDYLEQNVDYLEHSGDDPTGFWPHDCLTHDDGEPCVHYLRNIHSGDECCALDCLRYRDLKLVDYVALRMKEAS